MEKVIFIVSGDPLEVSLYRKKLVQWVSQFFLTLRSFSVFATPEEATPPSGKYVKERTEELTTIQVLSENWCGLAVKSRNRGTRIKRTSL